MRSPRTRRSIGRGVFTTACMALMALFAMSQLGSAQGRGIAPRPTVIVNGAEAVAGEVLIKFTGNIDPQELQIFNSRYDADENDSIGADGLLRRVHSRSVDVQTLLAFLRGDTRVAYVEPNYIIHAVNTPGDTSFSSLWGLQNTGQNNGCGTSCYGTATGTPGADIHATAAWDVSTGSRANVVAIVDTGVDYTHPDLAANIWSAPANFTVTIAGKTITCAAGTHGFNAITNTCDPFDDNEHGTHVSGTIGALGNNSLGVAGVNWTAAIMGSKFLDASGSGTTANAVNAIEFTIQAKAAFAGTAAANVRVLNNSWGGGGYSQALLDEINKASANDMLFVAAAGNNGLNNDVWASYPADYTYYGATNIIAVAATDNNDRLASFSNYGPTLVHLGAPGVDILSTTPGNTYHYFSGTSMATPHVSGAAALVLSQCALATPALKTIILNNVDVVGGLSGSVATNGRLDVDKALRACAPTSIPSAPTNLTATAGNAQVSLKWSGSSGASSYRIYRSTTSGSGYTPLPSVTTTSYTDSGLQNGTTYYYRVTAVNSLGESGPSSEASATPAKPVGPPAAPTSLTATGLSSGHISLKWTGSAAATTYNVKRSRTSGGPYTTIATGVNTTSYVDSGLRSGRRYYYVVSGVNASGESANSNQSSAVAP